MAGDCTTAEIWDALRAVIDPELGMDIVTLGLVYDVRLDEGIAHVTHTLTTRGCPMQHAIRTGIVNAAQRLPGVVGVAPHLVFDPEWHPGMMMQPG